MISDHYGTALWMFSGFNGIRGAKVSRPNGHTDSTDLPFLYQFTHFFPPFIRGQDFWWTVVSLVEVNVVSPKSTQAPFESIANKFAGINTWLYSRCGSVFFPLVTKLRGDISLITTSLDSIAKHRFGTPKAIHVGCIKKVDPSI